MIRYGTLLLISIFSIASPSSLADSLPTQKQIATLSSNANDAISQMLGASIAERLKYHVNSTLSENDAKRLCDLAKEASAKLASISRTQKKMLQKIEAYEGDDWDDLFGKTGLWRKASALQQITARYKTQMDVWQAISCGRPQNESKLREKLIPISTGTSTTPALELGKNLLRQETSQTPDAKTIKEIYATLKKSKLSNGFFVLAETFQCLI